MDTAESQENPGNRGDSFAGSADAASRARADLENLIAWDREFLWHPFTPMKPWCEKKDIVVIESAQREFLIDTQGRRYIDGVSSLWCNVHGHNVPELNCAVTEQLQRVAHTTLLGLANVPSILLARRLVELVRGCGLPLDKVFYSDNGSTAVEVACKMAYQYWRNVSPEAAGAAGGRTKFIAFESAYHGDTLGAVSVGGIPIFHHAFKSLCFPVDFVRAPTMADAGAAALHAMEMLLEKNKAAYAAIIIEPLVLGAGGMRMYPAEVLVKLRALADRYHTLLIADEVLTGFGRTGKMFAWEHARDAQIHARGPDFLCLSKGLTGGYMPLGVTLTTRKIFDGFYFDPDGPGGAEKTFFHGHTFTGHPLACNVALASLELFEKNRLLEHVARLMPLLADMVANARRSPFVADARQCGLIAAIDLAAPDGTPFPAAWRVAAELCTRLRAAGIMLRPLADTLVIMPPLAITPENLRTLCEGVLRGIAAMSEIVATRG